MRDIRFRGIPLNEENFVFGSLSIIRAELAAIVQPHEFADDMVYLVQPETIGQYIGRADRNDDDIYEGDIVYDYYNSENGVIEWDEEDCCFMLTENGISYSFDKVSSWDIEVVGNIHQNPELIF